MQRATFPEDLCINDSYELSQQEACFFMRKQFLL